MPLGWDELEQLRNHREWRIPIPPTCPKCDYNLTGLPHTCCPECGQAFDWPAIRRRAGRTWSALNTLRHANRDAKTGIKCALFGWAILIPIVLLRFEWSSCFLRMLAMAAGGLAIVLGLQVSRIRHVPAWARTCLEGPPPNLLLSLLSILLGLALFIASVVAWLPSK